MPLCIIQRVKYTFKLFPILKVYSKPSLFEIFYFILSGVKDDDSVFKKPREVVHKNTRFSGDPFSNALNKSQIQQAAALNAQVHCFILKHNLKYLMCTAMKCFFSYLAVLLTSHLFLNRVANMMLCFFQFKQGKVGPDGKELIPQESPTVNGYSYERTPLVTPGE